jgi:hypothetical protein
MPVAEVQLGDRGDHRRTAFDVLASRKLANDAALIAGESQAKATKDTRQAGGLIVALSAQRPYELRDVWAELNARGPKWRRLVSEAVGLLDNAAGSPIARQTLERTVGE